MEQYLNKKRLLRFLKNGDQVLALADIGKISAGDRGKVLEITPSKEKGYEMVAVIDFSIFQSGDFVPCRREYTEDELNLLAFNGAE